jgi:hypothetical protein
LQVADGLLSRLDSDAPEMVLAAATALVTLNALSWWSKTSGGWFWSQAEGHRNLRFLGETVLQLLNRSADAAETRRLLLIILELLGGGRGDIFYFNDIRVLVDVCVRELVEEDTENGVAKGESAPGGICNQSQEVRDNCRWLCVKVLEQVILRPEFSADSGMCTQIAHVLGSLLDQCGNDSLVREEAERVLSANIDALDSQ